MRIGKNNTIILGWAIIICSYFVFLFLGMLDFKSSYYVLVLLIVNAGIGISNGYFVRWKIGRMKKELGVTEDISIDELESIRVEKDYQENYVKKWKLNQSNENQG